MRICSNCKSLLKERHNIKFCSNKCQHDYQHSIFIQKWKEGIADGTIGIETRNISGHLRRYLIKKYKEKCSLCGWKEIHPITGKVPLEVDHIDGNSENNKEENLRLICPNCHALTPHFRNLNKGNGRVWRKENIRKSKG